MALYRILDTIHKFFLAPLHRQMRQLEESEEEQVEVKEETNLS